MTIILMLLGKLLADQTNWKQLLKTEGEAVVKAKLRALWTAKLTKATPGISKKMVAEGWVWTGPGGSGISDEGLGRGFVLVRDAIYRLLKATGVRGDLIVDGWRDGSDNATFAIIASRIGPSTSPEEMVRLTAAALIDHTL